MTRRCLTQSLFTALLARTSPLSLFRGRRAWIANAADNTTWLDATAIYGFLCMHFIAVSDFYACFSPNIDVVVYYQCNKRGLFAQKKLLCS